MTKWVTIYDLLKSLACSTAGYFLERLNMSWSREIQWNINLNTVTMHHITWLRIVLIWKQLQASPALVNAFYLNVLNKVLLEFSVNPLVCLCFRRRCAFKFTFSVESLITRFTLERLLSSGTRKCLVTCLLANFLSHVPHLYRLSPTWTLAWLFKLLAKPLPHVSHVHGLLSSVNTNVTL